MQDRDDLHSAADRRRARRQGAAGDRGGRAARRRRDRALHRPVSQRSDRDARRHPAAHPGGAAALPAGDGGAPGRDPRVDPQPGQARRRSPGADHGRRLQGASRGHLPALQAEAAHQGDDRPRGGSRAARRRAAQRPDGRSAGRRRGLRGRRQGRRRRRRGPRRRPGDPGRALLRGRRPHRRAAGEDVVAGPDRVPHAGRQGVRRGEVLRLLRLQRAVHQAALPPDPRDVPRREGGDAGPGAGAHPGPRRPVVVRADDRLEVRHPRRGPPRRQVAQRHRPVGLAHPDPRPPRDRPADAAVAGGRGGGRAGLRLQPA
jgi:hypothetical protein